MARQATPVKAAPVVAELGRPATPQEIADRKADSSRRHRENQTPINLHVLENDITAYRKITEINPKNDRAWDALGNMYEAAGLHSEAISAFEQAITLAPRKEAYHFHLGIALAYQMHYEKAIQALQNSATISTGTDGIQIWYVGFISPAQQFIGMSQGIAANRTWVANQLSGKAQTGSTLVGGVHWSIYDYRSDKDPGNLAYSMAAQIGNSDVVLFGTASTAEFHTLATAIAANLMKGG